MYSKFERDRGYIPNSTQIEDDEPVWFIHVLMEPLLRNIDRKMYRITASHNIQLKTDRMEAQRELNQLTL